MTEDLRVFLSTIYGEAARSSPASWRAIASVILNRVGRREWSRYKTPLRVIACTGFDAFAQRNSPYVRSYDYYGGNRAEMNMRMEDLEAAVEPLYSKREPVTTDAVLYYSPRAQERLHKIKPGLYRLKPRWNFDVIERVPVEGAEADDFHFYRYKA